MKETSQISIPNHVAKNLVALYGDNGKNWISNFPKFISRYEEKWQFKSKYFFPDAQFNVVLSIVQREETHAVFKCCVPNKEFRTEVLALKHYNGVGAVKLFQSDMDNGAMLLEQITPGTLLESITSIEEATKKALDTCKKLHKSIEDIKSFPTLAYWFAGFDRLYEKFDGYGPFSKSLIEKAKLISDELLSTQSKPVLLHGDLHKQVV